MLVQQNLVEKTPAAKIISAITDYSQNETFSIFIL